MINSPLRTIPEMVNIKLYKGKGIKYLIQRKMEKFNFFLSFFLINGDNDKIFLEKNKNANKQYNRFKRSPPQKNKLFKSREKR